MSVFKPEDVREIKDHFDFFDEDKNGVIDQDEFICLLQVLAPNSSKENAIRGFDEIDSDGNQLIDFAEFLNWWEMNWTVF